MPATYQLHEQPELDSPVLLVALEGWIDAGFAAVNAMATVLAGLDTEPVASFDADELLDHRARRPVLHLVEGVNTSLSWPGIELRSAKCAMGKDLLLLVGAEPDHSWRAFTTAVIDLAQRFGTRMVVGFGAYPAAVPHTRPTVMSVTASDEEMAGRWPFLRGTLDVPAGVQAAIERSAGDAGLPAIGLWAQVPHYTSAMAYPAASRAILQATETVAGIDLPDGTLDEEAEEARSRLDQIIAGNEEHARMVAALEQEADSTPGSTSIPSGDELAAELERFLREQGREQ
ncbi:MAG: PAC2 family protein [Acidimicrobiia bacterium]|nr:PAC2 family protein [Acidimicrobiia bacterium]